jgi:hypothetical protein
MQRSTVKTILLVIGSGIGGIVIFVAAAIGFLYYKLSNLGPGSRIDLPFERTEKAVSNPPPVIEVERFLGSHGIYSGDFSSDRNNVLGPGPGKLVGRITFSGKPVKGLRLRLALNGRVLSQWGTSDASGKYDIAVPYAQYRIDGYALDSPTANTVLKGKIDNPQNSHSSEVMTVADGRPGRGLDLDFVDPVRKKGPSGDVSLTKPIVLSWEPYPGATSYKVQLIEQKDPRNYMDQKRLFEWNRRPTVATTSIALSEHGVTLSKGFYYAIEVDAIGDDRRTLSNTPALHGQPDFFVTD